MSDDLLQRVRVHGVVPAHIAIIMDGNGRWAAGRALPRPFGHHAGMGSVREVVEGCLEAGVSVLTLFAFSQENWQRPRAEVGLLMQLFLRTLSEELDAMHDNGIRLRFIGDHVDFSPELRKLMRDAESRTAANRSMQLTVAVGYGGQWDIAQAAAACARARLPLSAENLAARLQTAGLPPVDLLIRTGGERRISNFMLWQLAYTELYFTETLWPEFREPEFERAIEWYRSRERRFGRVPEAA